MNSFAKTLNNLPKIETRSLGKSRATSEILTSYIKMSPVKVELSLSGESIGEFIVSPVYVEGNDEIIKLSHVEHSLPSLTVSTSSITENSFTINGQVYKVESIENQLEQ